MEGRRWSEGLHQAVEAKEGVQIQEEHVTLATITLQNYFRLYDKLAGMTGTAKTEEKEFVEIYDLHVVEIPTNVQVARQDENDLIFKTKDAKYNAVIDDIKERHEKGQPVLVGTISVEVSEHLSQLLTRTGIPHNVLNAKAHEREAEIIKDAGQRGAVTIATNMAGRGVDIKEWIDQVLEGLIALHTEGEEIEEWDLDGLVQAFNAFTDADFTVEELREDLAEISREALLEDFRDEALELYAEKEALWGPEV